MNRPGRNTDDSIERDTIFTENIKHASNINPAHATAFTYKTCSIFFNLRLQPYRFHHNSFVIGF